MKSPSKIFKFMVCVAVLISVSVAQADSEKKLKKQARIWESAGVVFTTGAVVDGVRCVSSLGSDSVSPGILKITFGIPLNSCAETVVAGVLAAYSFEKARKMRNIRKEQLGQQGPGPDGSLPPPDRETCSPEEELNCRNLAKIVKIKRKDCVCVPANPPIGFNGEINNSDLAQAVPASLLEAATEAVQKGNPDILLDAVEKETGADFGKFAGTDALAGAFGDALKSPEVSGELESLAPEGEEAVDEEKEGEVAFGGEGRGAAGGPGPFITGQTQLDPGQSRFKDKTDAKDKDKKGKLTVKKGSGIIADDKRGIFVAVTRRYQSVETSELKGNLIEQRGKYTEVKFIPDAAAVQEAVEKTKIGKKKSSLSEDIQKFKNP